MKIFDGCQFQIRKPIKQKEKAKYEEFDVKKLRKINKGIKLELIIPSIPSIKLIKFISPVANIKSGTKTKYFK